MKNLMMILCAAVMTTTGLYAADSTKQLTVNEKLAIANQHLKNQHLDDALQIINAVLEEEPQNSRALRLRANIHFANEDYEASLKDFDQVLKLNPRRARAHFERGIVNFALGYDELAMDDIENAFALNPELVQQIESKPNFGEKIHEMREKAHTAKFQVRHKGGNINTKKGGLITKVKGKH